jgi:hypothetical protein
VPPPSEPLPALPSEGEHDTPMTGIYIAVVVVEAIILSLLWLLGRAYS